MGANLRPALAVAKATAELLAEIAGYTVAELRPARPGRRHGPTQSVVTPVELDLARGRRPTVDD
jgi:hypothetical protein